MIGPTPLLSVVIGYLISALSLVFVVWFRDMRVNKKTKPVLFGIRGAFYATVVYLSFIQLDSVIKYVFFGILDHSNWNYQLGAILITIIWVIGVHSMTVIRKPTFKTMIFYITAWVYYIIAFLINSDNLGTDRADLPLSASKNFAIICISIEIVFDIIYLIKFQKRSEPLLELKPLWDLSKSLDKIFNRKFIIALFMLFSAELILQFEGLGLLYFL